MDSFGAVDLCIEIASVRLELVNDAVRDTTGNMTILSKGQPRSQLQARRKICRLYQGHCSALSIGEKGFFPDGQNFNTRRAKPRIPVGAKGRLMNRILEPLY